MHGNSNKTKKTDRNMKEDLKDIYKKNETRSNTKKKQS